MTDRLGDLTARIETLEAELGRLKAVAMSLSVADNVAAPPRHDEGGSEPSASRRDLLRYGAVALGAAAAAGVAASPAHAADGGPVLISGDNAGTASRP
jgi:hypothetical protein